MRQASVLGHCALVAFTCTVQLVPKLSLREPTAVPILRAQWKKKDVPCCSLVLAFTYFYLAVQPQNAHVSKQ